MAPGGDILSRQTVALVVIAKDEARMLEDCLISAKPVVDVIHVCIDDRTTDGTADIARQHGVRISQFTYAEDLAAARNTAQEGVTTDWILSLDADERLTDWGRYVVHLATGRGAHAEADADGVAMLLENQRSDGTVSSRNMSNVRLYRNTPRVRWAGLIHSEVRLDHDPKAGKWLAVPGAVGIAHLGYSEELVIERQKDARNLRLLQRQLSLDPNDGQAWAYLAIQHAQFGREKEARAAAVKAIASGWYDERPDHLATLAAIRDGKPA